MSGETENNVSGWTTDTLHALVLGMNETTHGDICWEVLEHLPQHAEATAFAEVARVLRPGGAFYLSTPHASPLTNLLDPAWWLAGHRHYAADSIRAFAEGAGLEVDEIMVRGDWFFSFSVALNSLYISKWIFRRGPFFDRWVNRRLDMGYRSQGGSAQMFLRCRKPQVNDGPARIHASERVAAGR